MPKIVFAPWSTTYKKSNSTECQNMVLLSPFATGFQGDFLNNLICWIYVGSVSFTASCWLFFFFFFFTELLLSLWTQKAQLTSSPLSFFLVLFVPSISFSSFELLLSLPIRLKLSTEEQHRVKCHAGFPSTTKREGIC